MSHRNATEARSLQKKSPAEGTPVPPTDRDQSSLGWFLVRRGIVGLTLASLIFGRLTFSCLRSKNSYYYYWDFWDSVALILDVVLLAALFVLLSTLQWILRGRTGVRVFETMFLLVFADGILTCLTPLQIRPMLYHQISGGVFVGLVVLMIVIRTSSRQRLLKFARMITLILFPLSIAVIAGALAIPRWSPNSAKARTVTASGAPPGSPIFLFVFDRWSYDRSTRSGSFLPSLKNLRALSEQSLWFSRAYSRSYATEKSLPAIVFQRDDEFVIENGGTFWVDGSTSTPTTRVPSLFQRSRDCGYRTDLIGFYHPYHKVVEGQLDGCEALCSYPRGTSLPGRMADLALKNSKLLADPVIPLVGMLVEWPRYRRNWYEINVRILATTEDLIGRCPSNTFAVIHWPYPHAPFVFELDGSFRSIGLVDQFKSFWFKVKGNAEDETPEEYVRAIHQMDRFVGRVIAALKAAGKYDEATIILTSDHSWQADPLPRTDRPKNPHVPLLIKMPHQTKMHVIDRPVINYGIQNLIDGVLKEGLNAEQAVDLINRGWLPGPRE